MKKKRIAEIDLLRGFAAFCLIIDHSIISTPINLGLIPWCKELGMFISSFDMPLFFMISGFVYHCEDYSEYLKSRLFRIGIPYMIFGLGSVVIHTFAGKYLAGGGMTLIEGIKGFLFFGGEYWFLYTMLLIQVVFPLLEKILCGLRIRTSIILLIPLIIVKSLWQGTSWLTIDQVLKYLPFYCIGDIASSMGLINKKKIHNHKHINGGTIAILLYTALYIYGRNESYIVAFITGVAAGVALWTILYKIGLLGFYQTCAGKALIDCGKYSMQLYLFNMYLQVGIRIVLCSVLGISSAFLIIFLSTVFNLLFTICICKKVIPRSSILRIACGM